MPGIVAALNTPLIHKALTIGLNVVFNVGP